MKEKNSLTKAQVSQRPMSKSHIWLGLVGFLVVVFIVAAVGSVAVQDAGVQYNSLRQPPRSPPSWLFGPVWTVLYLLIAISGWLVWKAKGLTAAHCIYAAQLILNAIWTPLFFGAGLYGVALADILALWVLITLNIALFWRINRTSALLLIPYWFWVGFASLLNLAIWRMN